MSTRTRLALSSSALVLGALLPLFAHAASATWTQYEPGTWWYWRTGTQGGGQTQAGGYGYGPGLLNPTVQISYYATITDTDTGQVLPPGSSVPVGANLSLEFTPHQDQDIYWFGTVSSYDSPYGEWEKSSAAPAFACNQQDFTGTVTVDAPNDTAVYIPFAVNPPAESLTGTGSMTCGGLTTASDGGMAEACTVTQAGTLDPVFTFGSTQGVFYYRYYTTAANSSSYTYSKQVNAFNNTNEITNECVGDNTPMTTDPAAGGGSYSGFAGQQAELGEGEYDGGLRTPASPVSVPVQSISYPLTATATASGSGPGSPTVTNENNSDSTSCSTDQEPSYTLVASDPDQNAEIRYGISWDNDGTVEEWAPAMGYVAPGTPETVEQAGSGSTFEVLVQDQNGDDSGWTIVNAASCSGSNVESCGVGYTSQNGQCVFTSCPSGYTQEGSECIFSGACAPQYICGANGSLYYEDASCVKTLSQSCSLGCVAGACVTSPSGTVTATPSIVKAGETSQISWSALGVQLCSVLGSNGDGAGWNCTGSSCNATSTETSSPIEAQTTYTLSCTGLDNSLLSQNATVNIVPEFQEQ